MNGEELAKLAYFALIGCGAMWSHYLWLLAEGGYTTGLVLAVAWPVGCACFCFGALAASSPRPPENGP